MTRLNSGIDASRNAAKTSKKWFLSRHGVVAAERFAKQRRTRTGVRQMINLFGGTTLIGLGVSLFVHSRLGVPAYDVMLTALRDLLGISLGQAGWLFTGSLYVVATLLGQRPKISGIFYVISAGINVDIWLSLIADPDSIIIRALFVVFGTASIAAGVALVVHAGLTGGSLELLMNAAEDLSLIHISEPTRPY